MNGSPGPSDFWAKLKHEDDDRSKPVVGWHPLAAHSAEVAAVTEALLERTILGKRLAALVGWDELSDVHVQRLCVLAALHDAGKVNHGFQNRARDAPGPRNGHVAPMVDVMEADDPARWLRPLGVAAMLSWFDSEEHLMHFLLATFGHHGRPVQPSYGFDEKLWTPGEDRTPTDEMTRLAAFTQAWFPKAFEEEAAPFPPAPPLQHAFDGVLTLADWIGSDERFFPFAGADGDPMPAARRSAAAAVEALVLDPTDARASLGPAPVGFGGVLAGATPYPIQQATLELPLHADEGSLTVLESDTGSGKTEAALARFLRLYQNGLVDGLYFAVPTRSAATQLHERVREAAARVFSELPEEKRPPVVQAVPGYIKADDAEATRLPGFEVRWDEQGAMRHRGWAAEHPKRFLAGPIVVGTVDQVLLSTLQASHAHLRGGALLRHFLVVDEVHASDVYMTALMDRVLDHHLAAGGHALLMSATLGAAARTHLTTGGDGQAPTLAAAAREDYPLLTNVSAAREAPEQVHAASSGQQKTVETALHPLAGTPEAVAALALEYARAGARVLVIRNLVADCQATQHALEAAAGGHALLFGLGSADGFTPAPHHSRFAPDDRQRLDSQIEAVFGKERSSSNGCGGPGGSNAGGTVAVATQTVEQSLDIDADLLITDLCPVDVLLQRIGRLHRHAGRARPGGFETARCFVLTPEARDLTPAITPEGHGGKGPHGLGTVYRDLRAIEAAWRVLEASNADGRAERAPWRIPADNRRLVEHGTHPERLGAIVEEGDEDRREAWQRHQQYLTGQDYADRYLPTINGLDRSQPFGACRFDKDADPKTRLGTDDYRVELPAPAEGPFGQPVDVLTIAEWHFHETPEAVQNGDATAEEVERFEGGFTFAFSGKRFRYDRMGLAASGEN